MMPTHIRFMGNIRETAGENSTFTSFLQFSVSNFTQPFFGSHWCLPGVPDTWNEIMFSILMQHKRPPFDQ